jgi:hypothetical protein
MPLITEAQQKIESMSKEIFEALMKTVLLEGQGDQSELATAINTKPDDWTYLVKCALYMNLGGPVGFGGDASETPEGTQIEEAKRPKLFGKEIRSVFKTLPRHAFNSLLQQTEAQIWKNVPNKADRKKILIGRQIDFGDTYPAEGIYDGKKRSKQLNSLVIKKAKGPDEVIDWNA